MSATKWLKKRLPSMTLEEKTSMLAALKQDHATEKNPMVRSSISERIRMLEKALK